MRRRTRLVVVTFLGAVVVACGIDAVGTYVTPGGDPNDPEAGFDGARPGTGDGGQDAQDESSEIVLDLDAQPIFDASTDVNPENCLKVCEAGTCDDAGTCVIKCSTGNPCTPDQPVVCPPGVPCDVACIADNSCNRGVDCSQASRCTVSCSGQGACNENKLLCSGDSCVATCSGDDSCNRGASCDAGSCILRCTGQNACNENTVECFSDTCSVQCGGAGRNGSCNRSVTCVAATSCTVNCLSQNACASFPVLAKAQQVTVNCNGQDTCNRGVLTSGGDSGILCKGQNACATNGAQCDGGKCKLTCDDTSSTLKGCCKAAACSTSQLNNCTFTTNGCP